MRCFARTDRFHKCYKRLPTNIQKKVNRQLHHLSTDIRHPSLSAKKIQGRDGIWEARVDIHHRMTFQINDEVITLRAVGPHDLLKKP